MCQGIGLRTTYGCDGDGNRIQKTEGGNTAVYVNRCYEKDITSGTATSHYYLGGRQIAVKKGSTLEYIHQDHLGSSSLSTDSSGNPISTMKVFSFGETRSSSGTLGTDKKYTGQRLDGVDASTGHGITFYTGDADAIIPLFSSCPRSSVDRAAAF